MEVVKKKLLSYEMEEVEYHSINEYANDRRLRRLRGWHRMKRTNFHTHNLEPIERYTKGKIFVKYERYGRYKVKLKEGNRIGFEEEVN